MSLGYQVSENKIRAREVIRSRYVELVCFIYGSKHFPLSIDVWERDIKLFHKVSERADKCF